MLKMRSLRLWIVRVVVGFAIAITISLTVVQVGQKIVRRRAERLLSEMRALEVGKSTWKDLQGIQTRWGAWGHFKGDCNASNCDYLISFTDWIGNGIDAVSYFAQTADYLRSGAAAVLHDHLPEVFADISVHDGEVDKTSFMVSTAVPKGDGPGWNGDGPEPEGYFEYKSGSYALLAVAKSVEGPLAPVYGPEATSHPEYRMQPPGGCEGCMGFDTEYTAATRPEDVTWLTGFDLSCMTRWSPCTVSSDLMPEAWRRYVAERKKNLGIGLPVVK